METIFSMVEFPERSIGKKALGFLARPKEAGIYPVVIVIHEIWGLVDHIKDVAMRFSREGYVALAVDLFDGKTISKLEEGRKFREQFTEDNILGDLSRTFDYLGSLQYVNSKRIGSIGFCMGGGLSLLFAC